MNFCCDSLSSRSKALFSLSLLGLTSSQLTRREAIHNNCVTLLQCKI
jgi:hypothetical protein